MKNQKGITLVALVVTIVVLLILAGVTIAMLTGDNGIITNAKNAQAANTEGSVRERMEMAYSSARTSVIAKSAVDATYKPNAEETELAMAKSIAKDLGIAGFDSLTAGGNVSGNGYTVTYTATDGDTEGTIEMKYSDVNFNTANAGKFKDIISTITVSGSDITFAYDSNNQTNQALK